MKRLTSLRSGDNVFSLQDIGDSVRLDRGWVKVIAQLDVLNHNWMQVGLNELRR